jgi:hypothetical protein
MSLGIVYVRLFLRVQFPWQIFISPVAQYKLATAMPNMVPSNHGLYAGRWSLLGQGLRIQDLRLYNCIELLSNNQFCFGEIRFCNVT